MGASYYANVVLGFLATKEDITKKIKKFDENTGEPLFKDEFDFTQIVVSGIPLNKEDSEELYNNRRLNNLALFSTTDDEHFVFGESLAETEDINYSIAPIEVDTVSQSEALKDFAKKYKLTPKIYLVVYASY